jgi:endonuclease YncB( thermonuclease family)
MPLSLWPIALALSLAAFPALAQIFVGRVVSVQDGDTLTVLADGKQLRIRLAEVDAPELRQTYGSRARESLSELCLDKPAQVTIVQQDRRGAVGRVLCDNVDASAEQVHRGMAWVYQRQAHSNSPLYLLEDQAQRSREGLWAEAVPVPPWAFRANRRNYRR